MIRKHRKAGIILLLIFLAVLTAVAVLLLPPGESFRIAILQQLFHRWGNGNLEVGGFTTNLRSSIYLQNIRWSDGQYQITIQKCGIAFRIQDLFLKTPVIRAVHLDSVHLMQTGQRARLKAAARSAPTFDPESLKRLRIAQFSLQHVQVNTATKTGSPQIALQNLRIDGTEKEPHVYHLTVQSDSVTYHWNDTPFTASSIASSLILSPEWFSIDYFHAALLRGTIHGTARLGTAVPYAFTGKITVDSVNVSEYVPGIVQLYDGNAPLLSGEASVSGTLQTPEKTTFSAVLAAGRSGSGSRTIIQADGRPDSLGAVLTGGGWQGNGRFMHTGSAMSGRVLLSIPDLHRFALTPDPANTEGNLQAEGILSGTSDQPKLTAAIHASDMQYKNIPLDTLKTIIDFREDRWHIRHGIFKIERQPLAQLFADTTGMGLGGTFSAGGKLSGLLLNPDVDGILTLHGCRYRDFPRLDARISLHRQQDRLTIDSLTVATDSLSVSGGGAYFFSTDRGALTLALGRIAPDHAMPLEAGELHLMYDGRSHAAGVTGTAVRLSLLNGLPAVCGFSEGVIDFSGRAERITSIPALSLEGTASAPVFNGIRSDSLLFAVSMNRDTLSVNRLEIYGKDYSADANLFITSAEAARLWEQPLEYKGQLYLHNMDISLFNSLMNTSIRGRTDLDLSFFGSGETPRLHGIMSLRNGAYGTTPSQPLLDSLESRILFQGDTVRISRLHAAAAGHSLDANALLIMRSFSDYTLNSFIAIDGDESARVIGMMGNDSLSISLKTADLPLSLLQPWQHSLRDMQGTMRLDAQVTKGTHYHIQGNAEADIDHFMILPFRESFTNGRLRLRSSGNTIIIDTLKFFQKNNGFFTGTGHVSLNGKESDSISLITKAEKISLTNPGVFKMTLDTMRLSYIRGQPEKPGRIRGGISLKSARYTQPLSIKQLVSPKKTAKAAPAGLNDGFGNTELNVTVGGGDRFFVDNNLARLKFRPELTIEQTLDDPHVNGRIDVVEGEVYYLDRRFTIKKGTLDFTDPYSNTPLIDLEAVTELNKYETDKHIPITVTMTVQGSLDQPVFLLSSEPAYAKSELISLMLLGIARDPLDKNPDRENVSLKEALQDRAAELSSYKIKGVITRPMETMFGIDELKIEGNLFKIGHPAGPQLIAAKKISENITLKYRSPAGTSNRHQIELNYQLAPSWFLTGEIDQLGQSGLDLKYEIKLK